MGFWDIRFIEILNIGVIGSSAYLINKTLKNSFKRREILSEYIQSYENDVECIMLIFREYCTDPSQEKAIYIIKQFKKANTSLDLMSEILLTIRVMKQPLFFSTLVKSQVKLKELITDTPFGTGNIDDRIRLELIENCYYQIKKQNANIKMKLFN